MIRSIRRCKKQVQTGASLTEFILAAPVVLLVGMTTVQAALIYHGKTTLNYATFEAARTGAVNHAQLSTMRQELGMRLAPLQGGDGSHQQAMRAIAKSSLDVQDTLNTRIRVLNPTVAAFEDWGVNSRVSEQLVIPNSHLQHRDHAVGSVSGLSLRDANLLKIEVTHGLDMVVPVVGAMIAKAMALIDSERSFFYAQNKFPLTAVATVRMQSEAWENEIISASVPPNIPQTMENEQTDTSDNSVGSTPDQQSLEEDNNSVSDCQGGEFGLGSSPVLIQASDYENRQCDVNNSVFDIPDSDSPSTLSDINCSETL